MDIIFSYIPTIYCIRNEAYCPLIGQDVDTPLMHSSDIQDIHKAVLKYCNDNSYPATMVYENEIQIIRTLEDLTNNELKSFILLHPEWDMIIIGQNTMSDVTLVDGFAQIYKLNDTSLFVTQYIYVASASLMNKVATNNLSSINTYIYQNTFCTNFTVGATSSMNIVAKIEQMISSIPTKYIWTPLRLE